LEVKKQSTGRLPGACRGFKLVYKILLTIKTGAILLGQPEPDMFKAIKKLVKPVEHRGWAL
jgi:hypothetical protein